MKPSPIVVGLSVAVALLVFLLGFLVYLGRDAFRRKLSLNRSRAGYDFKLASLNKKKQIIVGLFGSDETITQWLKFRRYRIGEDLTINGYKIELRRNPPADDPDVAGGIGLFDATEKQKEDWRRSGKPVAVQSEDVHIDGGLPARWTASYADPIVDLLDEMESFTPDRMA